MRRLASFITWRFFCFFSSQRNRNKKLSLLILAWTEAFKSSHFKKEKEKKSGYASYSESNCSSFVGKSSCSQIKSEAFKKKKKPPKKTKYYQ